MSDLRAEIKTGVLSGQFLIKDAGPMSNGQVFFFSETSGPPPSDTRYWRVPNRVAELDQNGTFSVELPEGRYYIGAIKRVSGKARRGPPDEGDYFAGSQGIHGQKSSPYLVKSGEKTELSGLPSAVLFRRATVQYGDGITAIEGTVLLPDGNPAEGALVFGYVNSAMAGKPLFVSDKTGKDGRYILRVAAGGKYYLKARDSYGGGPPAPGSLIGIHGTGTPSGVFVETGKKTSGISILVAPFAPGFRGQSRQSAENADKKRTGGGEDEKKD